MAKNSTIAWAVGLGTLAVAGVGIVIYEKNSKSKVIPPPANSSTGVVQLPGGAVLSLNTQKALTLLQLGHNPEAHTWAVRARSENPTPSDLAALTAAGL